jgi:hypothetical protein
MQQCQAMVAGIGGDCFRDPFLNDSSNALAYHPRSSRSRSAVRSAGMAANANR